MLTNLDFPEVCTVQEKTLEKESLMVNNEITS